MQNPNLLPLLFLLASLGLAWGCAEEPTPTAGFPISTSSDSARYYYYQGWQEIMDYGQYSASEASFRKAVSFDNSFTLGKSVLARVTTDLEERLELYTELEEELPSFSGPERAILDVYIGLVEYTNLREQNQTEAAGNRLYEVLDLAKINFGEVIRAFPEEIYIKCEYIEILHAVEGPALALDSINLLSTPEQMNNPFLLGYRSALLTELEDYEGAMEMALRLERQLDNAALPKTHTVYANLYFDMDSLAKAKQYADFAFFLDPNNLDASRLRDQIDAALASEAGL